jgi:hypothetical protein
MNNMNMPGFTAEASLYKSNDHYPAEATTVASPNQVVPQYGLCDKASFYCNRGYKKWCDILDNVCFSDF